MNNPARDRLLDMLVRAASGDLPRPRGRAQRALSEALEAERLIERHRDSYRATRDGLTALEDHGRACGPLGPVFVLFTDAVGSTELIERLVDAKVHRVGRHFEALRGAIAVHSGREIKSLGDGLMVVFGAASDAVACASAMQAAIAREGEGLGLRIGIHGGEPVREEGDYFGTPVIIARRLCDSARAGQTLVSELVQQLVSEREFESLGSVTLKGLSAPVRASALARSPSPPAELRPRAAVAA